MIRVLQVCNRLGPGGVEKNVQTISEKTPRDVFDVRVCATDAWGFRAEEIRRSGIKVECLHGELSAFDYILSKFDPDVVMIHRAGSNERNWDIILEAASKRSKLILEHNVFGMVDRGRLDSRIDLHFHKSMTSCLKFRRQAARVNYQHSERHTVIYNLLDIDAIIRSKPSESAILDTRRRYGIGDEDFLLLRVGRSDLTKWGDMIMYSIPHILKKVPKSRFLLVGAPSSRRSYLRNRYGDRVVCLNDGLSDRDLIEIYYSADVLIHASRIGESFGYSIAEAMACGLPVLVNATPWADNAQVELTNHMRTGIIANSPRAMAEAAAYLADHEEERRRMGQAAAAVRDWDSEKGSQCLARHMIDLLDKKGMDVSEYADLAQQWSIFPTPQMINTYAASYSKRLEESWLSIRPSKMKLGPLFQRSMWFARDFKEIAIQRVLLMGSVR